MSTSIRLLVSVGLVFHVAAPITAQTVCSAEIQFTTPAPAVSQKMTLNLFSTVGKGGCIPAEIRLMAAFYDASENLVCSGVIEGLVFQNNNTLSTNIELRPLNMVEFVRLRGPTNPPPKRLFCLNPDTDVEIAPSDFSRAETLRLRATILPHRGGGVATSEIRMRL